MSENKKEKVINVGITEELTDFINKWAERTSEEKPEKPALEVKRAIVEVVKKEVEKLKEKFNKENITETEWEKCVQKLHKLSEVVQWY